MYIINLDSPLFSTFRRLCSIIYLDSTMEIILADNYFWLKYIIANKYKNTKTVILKNINMNFYQSQKNTQKLDHFEFLFTKHRDGSDGKVIWKCEIRTCHSRIHTVNGQLVDEVRIHNHAVHHGKAKIEYMHSNMKQHAAERQEPTRVIVQRGVSQIPVNLAALLLNREVLSCDVRHHRQIARRDENDLTPLSPPKKVTNFFVFVNLTNFCSRCRPRIFRKLRSLVCRWYFLGNSTWFWSIVHGARFFQRLYISLCLCPFTRSNRSCLPAFSHPAGELGKSCSIVMDFELAAINIFRVQFPGITVIDCLFQFGQCV